MADTSAATGLAVQQWDDKFFTEHLRGNVYAGEMGSNETSVIQIKEDLTKKPGDSVTFALVNKLSQAATTGSDTLEGNEEDMTTRSFRLYVDKRRNAVRVSEIEEQKSAIGLRMAARAQLKEWATSDTEELISKALISINGVAYASASEAQKDAWLTNNTDRAYFASGYAGTDHSAGLAELDTTADLCTASDLSTMKLKATITAGPKIRPIRSEKNGRRYYIAYAHPFAFQALKADTTITQAQREVQSMMEGEKLFKGGDLLWDGIIVKEIDNLYDYATLTGVGASSATVVPVFLCGAQAIGYGIARRWKSIEETFDYGDKRGVAIDQIYGIEKMKFGSGTGDTDDLKDHGVVTGYFATALS